MLLLLSFSNDNETSVKTFTHIAHTSQPRITAEVVALCVSLCRYQQAIVERNIGGALRLYVFIHLLFSVPRATTLQYTPIAEQKKVPV